MMSIDEFVSQVENKPAEFPNVETNQCMALMHIYLRDVLGVTETETLAQPKAAEVFTNFDNIHGHEKFEKIENTADNVPSKGDLVVWNENEGEGAGHIAVFLEGDANAFKSLDCNWPFGSLPHVQEHNYVNVLGWLHPIGEESPAEEATETPAEEAAEEQAAVDPNADMYNGLDLNNKESMKVCVDIWKQVTDGEFIRKEAVADLQTKYDELVKQHEELQAAHETLPSQVKLDFANKIVKFFENL